MWKNEKFSLTEKIFREIKFLSKKSERKIPEFPQCAQCGNYGNSLSRIFGKNFVKVTVLRNKFLKSWFDEIFFWWERISCFSTLCDAHIRDLPCNRLQICEARCKMSTFLFFLVCTASFMMANKSSKSGSLAKVVEKPAK